ncbi:hypothetical protein [Chitinophaga sp.]|uniref:hypothetical protein n=1 Tax=Chitinophaga sp. TaxID=1869181 RepID=UPI002F95EDFF
MNKKILSILKKIYSHENGFYNAALNRHEHKIPATITASDLEVLNNSGFAPNQFETFDHHHALERMLKLQQHKKLTLDFAAALFLKGLTGEMPRARQTLMSYLYIKHLFKHNFSGKNTCEICGLPATETIDKTHQLYTYYIGHSWNEMPLHFLVELEEAVTFDMPTISHADKQKSAELLAFIEAADKQETPGKLEKRIAAHKILDQTDKYKRYGILQTLAECGILPNTFIKPKYEAFTIQTDLWKASENLTTSFRSDIILPLGGWKGENGVDRERYAEIFGGL